MNSIFVSLLCTVTHVPGLVLRYLPFSEKIDKRQKPLLLTLYGEALFINFLLCFIIEKNRGISITFYKTDLLLFCIVMAIVNAFVLQGFWREHLFTFGLVATSTLLLLSVCSFIVDTISYPTIRLGLIRTNVIFIILFLVLYKQLKHLLLSTVTPFLYVNSKDYWKTIWFIPNAMFFATLVSIPMNAYTNTIIQLASKLLIGCATLFLCRSIAADYGRMREREGMGRQIILQKQYYDALTQAVQTERRARHDFKHHLAAMEGLLDAEDIAGLHDYFERMAQKTQSYSQIPYTGNAAVDGVLYYYACIAAQNEIQFMVQCSLKKVTLPDMSLCSLLDNALDNAVYACKAFEGKRFINVSSEIEGEMFMLTIDNSFDGVLWQEGDVLLSRKRDHAPGLGIASMQEVCKAHGGICHFTAEGNQFEASFLLHL